jgi:predicted permease
MIVDILVTIILPVFAIIGVGFAVDRAFKLDMATLSKLNFYVTLPGLILIKTIDARLDPAIFGTVIAFTAVHFLLMLLVSRLVFRTPALRRHTAVLTLSAVFYNAGNFGLPLAQLAFGSQGTGVLAIVMMAQNLITFTWGLWVMDTRRRQAGRAIAELLKVPVLWAVAVALALTALRVDLPQPLRTPLTYLSDATIPVALLTLGIQLSRSQLLGDFAPLTVAGGLRLLVSPALAAVLAAAWSLAAPGSLDGLRPVLVVGAGLPVAVNVYILAVEYQRDARLASQMVVWTTLLSAATLTGWLLAVR